MYSFNRCKISYADILSESNAMILEVLRTPNIITYNKMNVMRFTCDH